MGRTKANSRGWDGNLDEGEEEGKGKGSRWLGSNDMMLAFSVLFEYSGSGYIPLIYLADIAGYAPGKSGEYLSICARQCSERSEDGIALIEIESRRNRTSCLV